MTFFVFRQHEFRPYATVPSKKAIGCWKQMLSRTTTYLQILITECLVFLMMRSIVSRNYTWQAFHKVQDFLHLDREAGQSSAKRCDLSISGHAASRAGWRLMSKTSLFVVVARERGERGKGLRPLQFRNCSPLLRAGPEAQSRRVPVPEAPGTRPEDCAKSPSRHSFPVQPLTTVLSLRGIARQL